MVNEGSFRRNGNLKFYAGLEGSLVVALCAVLIVQTAAAAAQEPVRNQNASSIPTTEISSSQPVEELPSAPVPQSSTQPQQQTQPAQQQPQPASQPQQQNQQSQQPNSPQEGQAPVGTAAAPYEKPTGVPGSRPAGAAIAPAKQRRVRAIVISLAVILAGAGAIGAVAGMSKASHSQP